MAKIQKNKTAWFHGSDESVDKVVSNDPNKLGYPKDMQYPRPPMAVPVGEDSRPWEQTWFEGAAAKTKKVMGPAGEEFKLKQRELRIPADEKVANAKVSAGFTRTAKPGDSFWSIYATDKKTGKKDRVLKATLNQIWGEELNEKTAHLSATPEYGKAVLAFVDDLGFSKVAFLMTGDKNFLKAAGWEDGDLDMVDETVEGAPAVEEIPGEEGAALDAEMDATAAEGEVSLGLLEQKHDELEAVQTELVESTSPESTAEVFVQLQDAEKMIDEAGKELAAVVNKLKVKTLTAKQKIQLIKIAAEAQDDAVDALTASDDVAAKAKQALEAADAAIEEAKELAGGEAGGEEMAPEGEMSEEIEVAPEGEGEEGAVEFKAEAEEPIAEASETMKFLRKRAQARKALAASEGKEYAVVPDGAPKDGDDEVKRAHPQGGHDVTNLTAGGKPKNEGEKFETIVEQHEKDRKTVEKMPTGELNASAKAKGNVKTAAADGAAKAYFNELYGQGDGASKQFGHDITKDAVPGGNETGSAVQAAIAETKLRVARAFTLAEVASNKGLCARTAEAKAALAEQIQQFDEPSFAAFKKLVDGTQVREASANEEFVKKASVKIPQVGQLGDGDSNENAFISKLSSFNWRR